MAPRATQQERSQRLYALSRILRDGAVHKAASLAARLEVSERTIYRDIARLEASGLPGKAYALDLANARFVKPEGIGALLGTYLTVPILAGIEAKN